MREGLLILLIKGGLEMMPSGYSSGYILHRLPYVRLGSKIEVMHASDRNLVHSEVKDMYMGHFYMLQICILILSDCELFSSSAVGGAVAMCI